jgi:hypothetical protein
MFTVLLSVFSADPAPQVVGMYIEQFCLAVLFFLKISDGVVFLAEGVLMLFLMAITLSAQVLFQRSFDRKLFVSLLL